MKYLIILLTILIVGCSSNEPQEYPDIIGREFLTMPSEPFCISTDATKEMIRAKRDDDKRTMKYLFDDLKYCFVYEQDKTVYVVREFTMRHRADRIFEVYFYEYGFGAYCIEEYCGYRDLVRKR